jgi:hypothetical protein
LLIFNNNSLVERLVGVVSKQTGWSDLTAFALKFMVTPRRKTASYESFPAAAHAAHEVLQIWLREINRKFRI